MENRRIIGIALVMIGLLGFAIFLPLYAPQRQQTYVGYAPGWGMMGQGMGQWMSTPGQSISIQAAIQAMHSVPSYAKVISNTKTVTLDSQAVSIVALAMMPDKAVNLTGTERPSYSTGDVFVIDGLINPRLMIPAGASVQFTVVNLDDDMYHNLVVSAYGPPYPYMTMGAMMSGGYRTPFLPPADYSQAVAHEYSYTLSFNQPGTLWYLCTYPSHAESGMYGEITVTG